MQQARRGSSGGTVVKGAGPKTKKDKGKNKNQAASSSSVRKKGTGGSGGGNAAVDDGLLTDIRLSDDVGQYVCGLLYHASLAAMQDLRTMYRDKGSHGARGVVFLHVPPLEGEEELARGLEVVLALISALVESIT
ncbi:uncharacterized protein B0I36DRAFT_326777 [Microdochium trichocladiopsis]|uniref:Uncharacterized protein n=1 Tax=Microdochium trichocladiopsis TaxID=1682393 RepID=A0A9P9BND1_9PEZI|nr:uncharacterized protein B0I36DRAFT_326777 [Microdochium trichocladiopsis]KAH7027264.1 hypothetical protein B0I36DRAFT_326777 [Microdochium trichocladiopsis]